MTLTPHPGAAGQPRMLAAQTALETRLLLRNGEQLLLLLIIPLMLLLLLSELAIVELPTDRRVDFLAPGIIALAIMSTAFTGQAVATGYERRYGALRRLATTPLRRRTLVAGKTLTVLAVELLQVGVLTATALLLDWRPDPGPAGVVAAAALVVTGTAAFSGLGLLLAGTLRAEATLATANLIYLVLLLTGGVLVPLDRYPEAIRPVLELLPITLLSDGLRTALDAGARTGSPWPAVAGLLAWATGGIAAAAATFGWD
ncbi:MAG: ABC transporter permease [Sporichthyaceae bacterium]|nr:ABC transporter permease [Sporichthyaceae bacterium]